MYTNVNNFFFKNRQCVENDGTKSNLHVCYADRVPVSMIIFKLNVKNVERSTRYIRL